MEDFAYGSGTKESNQDPERRNDEERGWKEAVDDSGVVRVVTPLGRRGESYR